MDTVSVKGSSDKVDLTKIRTRRVDGIICCARDCHIKGQQPEWSFPTVKLELSAVDCAGVDPQVLMLSDMAILELEIRL